MNANSKKLLSLLVVVTLVLSMVPAISFQAEAAFDPATSICQHCGTFPEGGWTALSARDSALEAGHYYLTTDISNTDAKTMTTVSENVCLELNGKNYTNGFTSANAVGIECTSGNLAIMDRVGGGRVNAASSDCKTATSGAVVVNGGNVYLYGGTFRGKSSSRVAVGANAGNLYIYEGVQISQQLCFGGANIYMYGGSVGGSSRGTQTGTFRMYGGTFTQVDITSYKSPCCDVTATAPYTVTLKAAGHTKGAANVLSTATCLAPGKTEYTCSVDGCGAKFIEETAQLGHSYTGTGGVCVNGCGETDPNAQPQFVPPATCACGANGNDVTWEPLESRTGFTTPAEHTHYYLAEDTVTIGGSSNVMNLGGNVCLYLNGKTLIGEGRFRATSSRVLHIFGEGEVIRDDIRTDDMFIATSGWIYLHSGTYTNNADVKMFSDSGDHYSVLGGTFNENPSSFVDKNVDEKIHWALNKTVDEKIVWDVIEKTEAVVRTSDNYFTCTAAEAAAKAVTENGYIQVGTAPEIPLSGQTVYVTNPGADVTFSGNGKLIPISGGEWNLDGVEVERDATNPFNNNRYLTVTTAEATKSYKFDMDITTVVLRPGTTSDTLGIYYKTNINVPAGLAELVNAYGVALNLGTKPTAESIMDAASGDVYTMINNDLVAGDNERYSGLLKDILVEDEAGLAARNAAAGTNYATVQDANNATGAMGVYANAYIAIDLDNDGEPEFVMADDDTNAENDIKFSLKDLMTKVDGMDLEAANTQKAVECYRTWAPLGMSSWGLTNLANKIAG